MKATLNGKPIKKLEFHMTGEMIWVRFIMEDGRRHDSYYFKGTT